MLSTGSAGRSDSMGDGMPSALQAWYAVCILGAVHALSIADRFLLGVVVLPLKQDLVLSNTEVGVLMGPAFLVMYCLFAIPIAFLADLMSRRVLIAAGVLVWSVSTAIFAFAQSFEMLVVASAFVGLGEACLLPAGISLLASLFPRAQLARATACFSFGATMGKVLAFVGGGALFAHLARLPPDAVGLLGTVPWRAVFIFAAIPGLILAGLMFTVREPTRRGGAVSQIGLLEIAVAELRTNLFVYVSLVIAGSAFIGMSLTVAGWALTYFHTVHAMSVEHAGLVIGLVSLLAGGGGAITSGVITDFMSKRGVHSAPVVTIIVSALLMSLFGLVFMAKFGNLAATVVGYGLFQFCLAAGPPAYLNALQIVTPEKCRASLSGICIVFITLVGGALGPTSVGLLTDYVFTQPTGIGNAISTSAFLFGLFGAGAALIGSRAFHRALDPRADDGASDSDDSTQAIAGEEPARAQ